MKLIKAKSGSCPPTGNGNRCVNGTQAPVSGGILLGAASFKKRGHQEQGSILILTLVIMMIVGMSVSALWRHLNLRLDDQHYTARMLVARELAEAGLEKAVAQLRVQPQPYRGEKNTGLGRGVFDVAVKQEGGPGTFLIFSTGKVTEQGHVLATAVLTARVVLSPSGEVVAYQWLGKDVDGQGPGVEQAVSGKDQQHD